MFKEKIIIEMKEVFKEIPFGIEHTLKVLKNAEDIMKGENIGEEEKEFISIIAILHDIGAVEAQKKYGSIDGVYQEKEGPEVAKEILKKVGYNKNIDRICFIIGNHHTPSKIDGLLKKITLLFVLFFLIHVGHTFVTNDVVGLPEKLQDFGTIKQEEHPIASDKYGWELVLVNRDNYIPDDYEMDLMELSNGQKIDSRIYPYLQEMFDDARNTGVYPFVRDGYRTAEEQQQILDDKIAAYRSEGYTKHMAEETAMEWVALPGTSEHQLGLAVDINADTSKCSRDDVYNWLLENSYKYGFIQRYPSGKTSITGVANEPWHYRYVGKEAAEEIHQSGLCLEEYVENLK